MSKAFTLYVYLLHGVIVALLVAVVWLLIETQSRRNYERHVVEKYRASVQEICDQFSIGKSVNTFEDMLFVYETLSKEIKGKSGY
jgi:uncharacterized membrane protein YccC